MSTERLCVPLLALAVAVAGFAAAPAAEGASPLGEGGAGPEAERLGSEVAGSQTGADERDARSGPEGLPGWFFWFTGRFSGHVNGAAQGGSRSMTDSLGFRAYGEDAQVQSMHVVRGAGMIDAGGSLRLWRDLSVGASYAQSATSDATTLTGAVPHPLRRGAFRELPLHELSFPHRQRVTHVFFGWRFPVVDRLDVSLFAGPSLYSVTQGVVTNVTVREAGGPPFETVRVDLVQAGEHRRNAVGGHVGLDVTYMPTRHVGVGFVVRYATATVDLPAARTGRLFLPAGGAEVGGGLRFRF
ncbi:MAG: hypothetical protein OXF93_09720 [Acidobacteria bacterium]|nr:hypothetical protein [Acidobacteriota bacterium]